MCMWPFIYSVQGAEVKIQLPIVYQLEFNYCALSSCVSVHGLGPYLLEICLLQGAGGA